MVTRAELDGVLEAGGRLIGSDGTDLGSIDQIVLDASGASPAFVSVRAGFFGITQRFVPLDGASVDGSAVRVAFDAGAVRSAPRVASDRGGLSKDQAAQLREHYGLAAETDSSDGSGTPEVTSPKREVTSPDAEVGPQNPEVTSPKREIGPSEVPAAPGAGGRPRPSSPSHPGPRPAATPAAPAHPRPPAPPHQAAPPPHPHPRPPEPPSAPPQV